ncbi:MAG: 30S ribosomal protein S20 [Candidatus Colwellbacteria bacterium]|nr:30S ribosomal protein S20 [Candidatus Colwellbacteria bacterium]
MPKTKSAKKALRQSVRRKAKNLAQKKSLKATVKKYERLVSSGDIEGANVYLPALYKALDKGGKSRIIKKNKSSRLKSRLTRQLRRANSVNASS